LIWGIGLLHNGQNFLSASNVVAGRPRWEIGEVELLRQRCS
jgi:hypothetical protein